MPDIRKMDRRGRAPAADKRPNLIGGQERMAFDGAEVCQLNSTGEHGHRPGRSKAVREIMVGNCTVARLRAA